MPLNPVHKKYRCLQVLKVKKYGLFFDLGNNLISHIEFYQFTAFIAIKAKRNT